MAKKTVQDIDVEGKRALVRVDYNVPFEPSSTRIADDSRIQATLPTIRYLLDHGASVVVCSHLGRPRGGVVEKLRLKPVAERLQNLLGRPVAYLEECTGEDTRRRVQALHPGDVALLENVRFHPGEERNDPEFARALASLADLYVNDAFAASHRAHASTEGVAHELPAVAGFLLERELRMLGQALDHPGHPFVAVLGGAKVSDKLGVVDNLLDRVDALLIGGGMAATFLKAQGYSVGGSPAEDDRIDGLREAFQKADRNGVRLLMPSDVVVGERFEAGTAVRTVPVESIPDGWLVMDVGPRTVGEFEAELLKSKTVLWNGPMGVFEFPAFAEGTKRVARVLAGLNGAATVLGGGSTAEAIIELGLADAMTHVSTGGGASLEFLEGRELPGIAVIENK